MEQEKKKIDNRAMIGTVIFHIAVLLAFIFFGLTTPLPLPEEEGVMVNLGFSDQGMGQRQPLVSSPPLPQPSPTRSTQAPEDVATQDVDESVSIPASPENQERPVADNRPQPEPPQPEPTQPTPEPEPEPTVNPNALFPGRDQQTTANQNQGQTGQPGNQGAPQGTPDGEADSGAGQGSGIEFSLSGRRANNLPLPEYTTQSQGRVVVTITVNRNGQVIRAIAGARGTTTSDRVLWAAAEAAALRASFDVKSDAPHEQTGTITYNFIRLN